MKNDSLNPTRPDGHAVTHRGQEPTTTAITSSDDLPIYLTPDEAASVLRTTRKAIYVRIERQQLPGVKRLGKRILIRSATLLEWLDQQCPSSLQERRQR